MTRISFLCAICFGLIALGHTPAQAQYPSGLVVSDASLSPDGRLGVLIPKDWDAYEFANQNALVDRKARKVLTTIQGETGMEEMNHGGLGPRWSKDSSLLLWEVDGKWFPRALVLLQVRKKDEVRQLDLLKSAQQEILSRTRKAYPKEYETIRKRDGYGAAYPDTFTINVITKSSPVTFPFVFQVELTSDPKSMALATRETALEATLEGKVTRFWNVKYSKFEVLGPKEVLQKQREAQ